MAINFPVQEGLLDLLRDFTIAVVQKKPDNLEKFAYEYFTALAASMEAAEAGSVECSSMRSTVMFDESMYGGYRAGDFTPTHSQQSVQSHAGTDASVKAEKPVEKCPDDAEACLEKWRQEEEAAAKAAAGETDTEAGDGAVSGAASAVTAGKESAVGQASVKSGP